MTTKRQKIAIILLILAAGIDIWGYFTSAATTIRVPVVEHADIDYWKTIGFPPINVTYAVLLTAEGALSVNTPITVHVAILQTNASDFLAYFGYIGFTNAFDAKSVRGHREFPDYFKIPLYLNASNSIVADGEAIWLHEGESWMLFLPRSPTNVVVRYPDVERGMYTAMISSVSDTLNAQNNVVIQRLTWYALGFSVLMLQPILDVFVPETNPANPQSPTQAKPQGLWHQHKLWRKSRSKQSQTANP